MDASEGRPFKPEQTNGFRASDRKAKNGTPGRTEPLLGLFEVRFGASDKVRNDPQRILDVAL